MNEVLEKIKNNEYISKYDLSLITNQIPNFDIIKHNKKVIDKLKLKYKNYFENMYKGIDENVKLDDEQIESILSDEKYSLVIAGAGTGKTTTIVSKIKYLVDIKKVDPSKILVMSFTKKATNELVDRLIYDFNLNVDISTFHSLGFKVIRNIYKNHNPYVVDKNVKNDIFLNYIKEKFTNKEEISNMLESFENEDNNWYFSNGFKENYNKFKTFDEYFKDYEKRKYTEALSRSIPIKYQINNIIEEMINDETIRTIKGEVVKSKGEAIIANYLFKNGIEYNYEKVYEGILPDFKSYKPDFSIKYGLDTIYLEYYGLSNCDDKTMDKYNKIKNIKEKFHEEHNTKYIKIDYMPNENIIETLQKELDKYQIKRNPLTDEEIFNAIVEQNKCAEFYSFRDFLYSVIESIKSSPNRDKFYSIVMNHINSIEPENTKMPLFNKNEKNEKNKKLNQFNIIVDFYKYYQNKLFNNINYGFDYADMIYYATTNLMYLNKSLLNYEYIFIDEYQDISVERYELTYKLGARNSSKIIAVGDDWQSIYAFSGSNIKYIYNFENNFKYSKLFKITTTYRNSQNLVDYAGTFIMKNKMQIQKDLIAYNDNIDKPIQFIKYNDIDLYDKIKQLIILIHNKFKDDSIMILARYNKSIDELLLQKIFKDELDTKVSVVGINDLKLDAMTIHKAKGLTTDHVILIDFDNFFPQELPYNDYFVKNLMKNKEIEEPILYAEERRVFYVALTRAKKYTFIMTPNNPKKQSKFYKEIEKIINNE